MSAKLILQTYLLSQRAPVEVLHAMRDLDERLQAAEAEVERLTINNAAAQRMIAIKQKRLDLERDYTGFLESKHSAEEYS